MKKIFITDYFKKGNLEQKIFKNIAKVICLNKKDENSFPKEIEEADGLLVWHTKISEKTIKKIKKCKAIVRYGVGCDNIDLFSAQKYNIPCANTPDYGVDEVADTAAAMILSFTRKILQYNNNSKNYKVKWQENVLFENIKEPIKRSEDYFIGIIGAGRIGSTLALRMKSFGFKIGFYDPNSVSGYEKVFGIKKFNSLNELLKNCNIISINAALNEETCGIINKKFIKQLKMGSILVNTARGTIVNKLDDIYYGLKSGKLAGVGLDVLPEEPPSKNEKLVKAWKNSEDPLNNKIIINPHAGYYSTKSVIEMRVKAAENLKNIIQGKKLKNIVN